MFGAKIIGVDDSVADYKQFSEFAKISDGETRVATHRGTVKFVNFPASLPFLIRHLLMDVHKTKKMILKEQDVETDDNKILINRLILMLSMIRIDSKCDCDQFQLSFENRDPSVYDINTGKSYIYVNSKSIKFLKDGNVVEQRYINDMDITYLEFDRYIKFSGVIEEQNSYSTNSIFKYTSTLFPINVKQSINDKGLTVSGGQFTIVYADNVSPKSLIKWALQTIVEIIDSIDKDNMVEQFNGQYSVTVPMDRSGIIAYFIDTYVTSISYPKVIKIDRTCVARETKMLFHISHDEIEAYLKSAFKTIRTEIGNLIKDLQ
jgi:hypothetical protein